jgi:hypothetical protein
MNKEYLVDEPSPLISLSPKEFKWELVWTTEGPTTAVVGSGTSMWRASGFADDFGTKTYANYRHVGDLIKSGYLDPRDDPNYKKTILMVFNDPRYSIKQNGTQQRWAQATGYFGPHPGGFYIPTSSNAGYRSVGGLGPSNLGESGPPPHNYHLIHNDIAVISYLDDQSNIISSGTWLARYSTTEYHMILDWGDLRHYNLTVPTIEKRWSDWALVLDHTVDCGDGAYQEYSRTCVDGNMQNGSDCVGLDSKIDDVKTDPCPIDGGWSEWTTAVSFDECGVGDETHERTCDNPEPLYGGTDCVGLSSKSVVATNESCTPESVDGGWSDWISLSTFDGCGEGSNKFNRTCTNPEPDGGAQCEGTNYKSVDVYNECPIDESEEQPLTQSQTSSIRIDRVDGPMIGSGAESETSGQWVMNNITYLILLFVFVALFAFGINTVVAKTAITSIKNIDMSA